MDPDGVGGGLLGHAALLADRGEAVGEVHGGETLQQVGDGVGVHRGSGRCPHRQHVVTRSGLSERWMCALGVT